MEYKNYLYEETREDGDGSAPNIRVMIGND